MDLGKKLHMSLDDLIKSDNSSKRKPKASEKPAAKTRIDKKNTQAAVTKLKVKADPRKKTRAGKARTEPASVRGGKRGQTSGGKRVGVNSAVRVRFGAPKIMTQTTQRHVVHEPPVQTASLASFVSSLQLNSKKEAQRALRLAKQIEAMAQERLGHQNAMQKAPRAVHNESGQREEYSPERQPQRPSIRNGSVRRTMQRPTPPAEPANPLHDPSRYDRGWEEYAEQDDDMVQDVKPTMAQLHARTYRMAH